MLIVADAVQVEAAHPPQQQSTSLVRCAAELREELLELDEARIDQERRRRPQPVLRVGEAERILEDRAGPGELVQPARNGFEQVARAQPAAVGVQRHPLFAESSRNLDDLERARPGTAGGNRIELDEHVVSLEMLPDPSERLSSTGLLDDPDPQPAEADGEREARRDRVQRARAERPRA